MKRPRSKGSPAASRTAQAMNTGLKWVDALKVACCRGSAMSTWADSTIWRLMRPSLSRTQNGPPVPPGQLGPIVQGEGGGPPIECRGVPVESCRGFGNTGGEPDVVRYIITCTSVCTPIKGDVRIDILGSNGTTRYAGDGSYSSGDAVPAPAPAISDPGSS